MKSILLIEDDKIDAEVVRRSLVGSEFEHYRFHHAMDFKTGVVWIEKNNPTILLVDLNLPDCQGVASYRLIQKAAPETPVIVLTGTANEAMAAEAIGAGAQDYLCKSDLNRRLLTRCIRYALQRSQMQNELRYLAYRDELTGLANRSSFHDLVQKALEFELTPGRTFAVLYIDLDDFKTVNDCLGHAAGDQLLIEFASRLKRALRNEDTISRFGGDEFIVLLREIQKPEDVILAIERIQHELAAPIVVCETEIHQAASIGAVIAGEDHRSVDALIRDADTAMYHAKGLGKSRYAMFDQAMHQKVREKLVFSAEVRRALDQNELVLFYQPLISLDSGSTIGFEALVRWNHPEQGILTPDRFLHLMQDKGSMEKLGHFVLHEACSQMKKWRDQFPDLRNAKVCVNISPPQFSRESMFAEILEALNHSSLPANGLEIEITEEGIIENLNEAIATATKLKESNIRLAIDDFGTGYSSLSQLARFPFDTLKIDREFVNTLEDDPEYGSLFIRTIVNLAEALQVEVVAEGIEHQWQQKKLSELDCHYGQGYLFARPMPVSDVEKWLVQVQNSMTKLEAHEVM